MHHFNSIIIAFNLNLYTPLVVWHNINLRLLSLLCFLSRDVAFVMIQLVALNFSAMTALHARSLPFDSC